MGFKRRALGGRTRRRSIQGLWGIAVALALTVASLTLAPLENLISFPPAVVRWRYELIAFNAVVVVALTGWLAWLSRSGETRSAERKLHDLAQMTGQVELVMRQDIAGHLAGVIPLSTGLLARPDVLKQLGSGLLAAGGPGGGGDAARLIRHSESVTEVFRQANRSLLLLGEAGSGKSLLLAQLCRGLCQARVRAGRPPVIPVLVSLSSWGRDDSSLKEWLCRAIADAKRYKIPSRLVRECLEDGALLPVLDSLDEVVPAELRGRVIEAVNDFVRDGSRPLAIACRTAEYLEAGASLELNYAIEIAQPSHAEAADYLGRLDSAAARAASAVPQEDRAWWDLISTPLMLAIISRISGCAPEMSIPAGTPVKNRRRKQLREQIIAKYVQALAGPRIDASALVISPDDGLRWLRWLAARMSRHDAREFSYDTITPEWIADITSHPTFLKEVRPVFLLWLAFLPALLGSIVIALLGGLAYAWQAMITLISCGPLLALVTYEKLREYHFRPDEPIRPVARVTLPAPGRLPRSALLMMLCGMAGTLAAESVPGLFTSDSTATVVNKLLVVGLTSLLPGMLLESEARSIPDEALLAPGARLRQSRASAWRGVAFAALPIAAISGTLLALRWNDDPLAGLTWFFSYGIVCAACMWLIFGGAPVMQHRALVHEIARQGYGPLEYLQFLDWATARMLLRTVGSAYVFPHQEIQDYLARSWVEESTCHDQRKAIAKSPGRRRAR